MTIRLANGEPMESWCGELMPHERHGRCPGGEPLRIYYDTTEELRESQARIMTRWTTTQGVQWLPSSESPVIWGDEVEVSRGSTARLLDI